MNQNFLRPTWNHEIGICLWKLSMELLKSLSRHLTVQKDLRLLNGGTLNRGRNLCVTVAIDHSTVDGFHDELQLSAKKYLRKGASTNQLSQRILFGSLEWLSLHFCFWPIWIPPIREHSITRITPRIRLVRGWRSLERNSCGSRPWAGGQK